MALRDIVDVQIVRQTAAITRVGFGTLAFVFEATTAPTLRVLTFGSAQEIANSGDLTANARAALSAAFSGSLAPVQVKAIYKLSGQVDPENDETYVEALTAAQAIDEDWYCVTIQSRSDADISAVAAWVEARDKIFIAATASADVLNPALATDIGSSLLAASFSRTGMIYAGTAMTAWPDTTWAGGMLPYDPGSATWAFKAVPGVAGQKFTSGQITALENKRVTRIENIQGLSRTVGGYTSDPGAYLDIIRGIDWLKQTMAEDIFVALANNPKIPYTNAGISIVEGLIWSRLQAAINRNVIDDDDNLTVFTPDVASIPQIDRANRHLPDVRFTARLAGALHSVVIRGTVSV